MESLTPWAEIPAAAGQDSGDIVVSQGPRRIIHVLKKTEWADVIAFWSGLLSFLFQ